MQSLRLKIAVVSLKTKTENGKNFKIEKYVQNSKSKQKKIVPINMQTNPTMQTTSM